MAVTHPALIKAQHLENILAGRPSSLPAPNTVSIDDVPVVALLNPPPTKVEISIEGPFPQPAGAFGLHGWRHDGCTFYARKAPPRTVLAGFFRISPKLIFEETTLPEGLYDILVASPPEQRAEGSKQFIDLARAKWGVDIYTTCREVTVYVLTVYSTNAPGLKAVQKGFGGGGEPGGFSLSGSSMSSIASLLEERLDRPVINETGLQGLWAADLKWEMSEAELSSESNPDPATVIKAVREQLGLDMRSVSRTMPALVIRSTK